MYIYKYVYIYITYIDMYFNIYISFCLDFKSVLVDIAVLSSPTVEPPPPSPSDKTTAAWVHLVLARREAKLRAPGGCPPP